MSDSDSNEVRDYLLGKLPGEAAERFEERLFADDEVLRSAGEQQDALIDEFLSGDLNAQDEAVFRAQVERSTTLQNRVETHRTLLRALERRAEGSHRGTFSTEHGWVWLLATCLVVAAVAAGVLRQQAKSAQTELALSSQPSSLVRPASPPAAPDSIFFLSASVTRGQNTLPLLKIPATARLVEIQIELPASAQSVQHWKLVDLDGRVQAPSSEYETKHAGEESYVPVELPADALPDGDHTIRLQATANGAAIDRKFRVRRTVDPPKSHRP